MCVGFGGDYEVVGGVVCFGIFDGYEGVLG